MTPTRRVRIIRITARGGRPFCAALQYDGFKIVRAAPILHYMVGWSPAQVRAYAQKRGWDAHVGKPILVPL